ATRPGTDHALLAARIHRRHLLHQVVVDERAFFHRTRHRSPFCNDSARRCFVVVFRKIMLLPALATLDDELARPLVAARLVALGRNAPRRLGVIALGASLATAVRVVDGVHRRATHVRPESEPAITPRLADRDVLVIGVADLPNRRPALDQYPA